jgi:hypothetical protein
MHVDVFIYVYGIHMKDKKDYSNFDTSRELFNCNFMIHVVLIHEYAYIYIYTCIFIYMCIEICRCVFIFMYFYIYMCILYRLERVLRTRGLFLTMMKLEIRIKKRYICMYGHIYTCIYV